MRIDPQPGKSYLVTFNAYRGEELGEKPVPKDMPGVKGVYVGGCIARGLGKVSLKRGGANAHAHNHPQDRYFGWVCFQTPEDLANEERRMHELAHILSPKRGHTNAWRAEMARLGQPIPPRHQPRKRNPRKSS